MHNQPLSTIDTCGQQVRASRYLRRTTHCCRTLEGRGVRRCPDRQHCSSGSGRRAPPRRRRRHTRPPSPGTRPGTAAALRTHAVARHGGMSAEEEEGSTGHKQQLPLNLPNTGSSQQLTKPPRHARRNPALRHSGGRNAPSFLVVAAVAASTCFIGVKKKFQDHNEGEGPPHHTTP